MQRFDIRKFRAERNESLRREWAVAKEKGENLGLIRLDLMKKYGITTNATFYSIANGKK